MPSASVPSTNTPQKRNGDFTASVTAWDLPARLFHWLLLALVISAWVSVEFSEDLGDTLLVWHRWNGLAILTLLVWRLLWGFAGSSTSRFSSFVRSPATAVRYTRDAFRGIAPRYLGHNPLGSIMVIALLLALVAQTGLGLFSIDDDDLTGGPLSRLVSHAANKTATHWHDWVFNFVLLPLAGLHIATNVFYGRVKKEPLITSMVTGEKPAGTYADEQRAHIVPRPMRRAFVCLIAAIAIVFGGLLAAGGQFT